VHIGPQRERAEAELRKDAARSNYLIMREAGVSESQVRSTRHRLEAAGTIPRIPVRDRATRAQPGPVAGSAAARRSGHPETRDMFEMPPAPDWERGLCTTVPRHQRMWWTSDDASEREAAARYCQGCPILQACETWSLALPWDDRSAVYAGMIPGQRLRRKREIRDQIMAQALEGIRWP
jgi:hypothetical protein